MSYILNDGTKSKIIYISAYERIDELTNERVNVCTTGRTYELSDERNMVPYKNIFLVHRQYSGMTS